MQVHHVDDLVAALLQVPAIAADAKARELAVVMTVPAGRTSSGHAYLQEPAWVRFRDWVPHILAEGPRALAAADAVVAAARAHGAAIEDAAGVVRQVVLTAAITAPPDLWLLRAVLGAFARLGLSQRLLAGDVVTADAAASPGVIGAELRVDLRFLLSRGLLLCAGEGFRIADHDAARAAFATPLFAAPHDARLPSSSHAASWARVFAGTARDDERAALLDLLLQPLPSTARAPGRFSPTPAEIELGFRLVPVVVGLRAASRVVASAAPDAVNDVDTLFSSGGASVCTDASLAHALVDTLCACGVGERTSSGAVASVVGKRVLERGIGPFGIIEAYHGYMRALDDVLTKGRGSVWVERSANVAASQDANRATFERANDALDRFCRDTGFRYRVFIEHAMGRGEATRQRSLRTSALAQLTYVGADLEDAAIDAALAERDAGHLPANMVFVRNADIGKPAIVVDAMRAQGIDPNGAVMIVGNGFHEVREQTDERMTEVLEGYARAGIVLLFTEETGLGVEDLLETAWNTYHAGFKYVHERSGQGLRPAEKRPPSRLEDTPPASWAECAERAGYVRLDAYSPRGRTVYPYTPASGSNPAISVTHFCVPAALATSLGLR